MRIAFIGSSLVSAYWNGAATYYRGLLAALARRGHAVTFLEPDWLERQRHRDIPDPDWAKVVVWPPTEAGRATALATAASAELVVKASGVGLYDRELEAEVLALKGPGRLVVFWDVDAPATLARLEEAPDDPLRPLIRQFDLIFTYGGGRAVVDRYLGLGAAACVPIYNGLDPTTHYPVERSPDFAADLAFLGNRLPDREARVDAFFVDPARHLPTRRFLLGGSGWDPTILPPNVEVRGHVATVDHNRFNCSPLAVLNVTRESMARCGWSPATRVFEAAGGGACLITDAWQGVEAFFEPGREILIARNGEEVAAHLAGLDEGRARAIGAAARRRALDQHSYDRRAALVDAALGCRTRGRAA
jgi:spore maturation protein CgeB